MALEPLDANLVIQNTFLMGIHKSLDIRQGICERLMNKLNAFKIDTFLLNFEKLVIGLNKPYPTTH